jgi:hypothetical protein
MKDPAFLFYPGDYLRDTQCLSEPVQVAYDRIMCEHMRDTYISPSRLNFFTKNFSKEEIAQLLSVIKESPEGYYIEWVMEGINKRRAYSESRRKNRAGKNQKDDTIMTEVSSTYEKHMENEIEDENESVIGKGKEGTGEKPEVVYPFESEAFLEQWAVWKQYRAKEHKFRYKSVMSEQAALAELGALANGSETTAIAIMHQSIAKGWKGFFELKNDNGTTKPPAGKGKVRYSDDFKRKIAERLRSG